MLVCTVFSMNTQTNQFKQIKKIDNEDEIKNIRTYLKTLQSGYCCPGSFIYTRNQEIFLDKTVEVVRIKGNSSTFHFAIIDDNDQNTIAEGI